MRIQSPLSNLCEILDQAKSSATQYQATLKKNEAATRTVLIDPVLRALGWDTANTYMVEVEKTLQQTRVDYALFDNNGAVRVIIEAKPLGDNLAQQSVLISLVTYAFTFGLQDVFLTDGLIWQHFTDFQPGRFAPTKVLNLAQDNSVESAAYLVHRLDAAKFWPEAQTIDVLAQQVAQLESVISTLQQEVAQLKAVDTTSNTSAGTKRRMNRSVLSGSTVVSSASYVNLDAVPDLSKTKPASVRLSDGTEVPVRAWKDVLREACKFTLTRNPSVPVPLQDRSGRKVSLLSTVKPPPNIQFDEVQYNGQTIYIYTNYDANNCVANAAYILEYVPADQRKVEAAVAFQPAA